MSSSSKKRQRKDERKQAAAAERNGEVAETMPSEEGVDEEALAAEQ